MEKKSVTKESEITIACFGLAFKPNIDDLRESPALHIVQMLSDQHAGAILVVEPNVETLPAELQSKARLVTVEEALEMANINICLVAHKEFSVLNSEKNINKEIIYFVNSDIK